MSRIHSGKPVFLLLAATLLAVAAWFVHAPDRVRADAVPEQYRETVQRGLAYLVKNQAADGHWEGDDGKHPIAMTGLVGLALLMEKENENFRARDRPSREPKYFDNIRKAADWLMDRSQRDGLLISRHGSEASRYMEGHGLAMIFLAGVWREENLRKEKDTERVKKLQDVLSRAVKSLVKAQSSAGGWHHTSRVEGHDFDDPLVTAIQIQALQAAENAGVPVPHELIRDGQQNLQTAFARVEPGTAPSRRVEVAAALAGVPRTLTATETAHVKWRRYCEQEIPIGPALKFGRDELAHYYFAQSHFERDDFNELKTYRKAVFDQLQQSQGKDGSWPAAEGLGVGQVYATALWCTVLQLDNKNHPSRGFFEIRTTTFRIEATPASGLAVRHAVWYAVRSAV